MSDVCLTIIRSDPTRIGLRSSGRSSHSRVTHVGYDLSHFTSPLASMRDSSAGVALCRLGFVHCLAMIALVISCFWLVQVAASG